MEIKETLEEAFKRICEEIDYIEFDYTSFRIGAELIQKQFKESIDRLQEKYDENGYDANLLIKLQRVEQHFDATINIYASLLKESFSKEELALAFSQGWYKRERLDDLVPEINFPEGLDYEQKQHFAFQQWFEQIKNK